VKEVPLTQGYVALVDDEDHEIVASLRWHVTMRGTCLYAARNAQLAIGKRPVLMHRVLLGGPSERIDHADGNGLNNCRANLRLATGTQNLGNQRAQIGKTSRFKGVTRHTQRPIWWVARLTFNRRRRSLGVFRTEDDAARAYDEAARELFGSFAALNFPNPGERSAHQAEIGAA
jgi:hypothetical protein